MTLADVEDTCTRLEARARGLRAGPARAAPSQAPTESSADLQQIERQIGADLAGRRVHKNPMSDGKSPGLIVFVHGLYKLWPPYDEFARLLAVLKVNFPGFDIAAFRYFGTYWSSSDPETVSARLAEFIATQVKTGSYVRVVLLGHSFGCLLIRQAVLLAQRRREPWLPHVERLVLMAGTTAVSLPPRRGMPRWRLLPASFKSCPAGSACSASAGWRCTPCAARSGSTTCTPPGWSSFEPRGAPPSRYTCAARTIAWSIARTLLIATTPSRSKSTAPATAISPSSRARDVVTIRRPSPSWTTWRRKFSPRFLRNPRPHEMIKS